MAGAVLKKLGVACALTTWPGQTVHAASAADLARLAQSLVGHGEDRQATAAGLRNSAGQICAGGVLVCCAA